MTIESLGGRKFVLTVSAMLILTGLAAFKPEAITAEFISALLGVIGSFTVANGFLTAKSMGGTESQQADKSPESTDTEPELNPELLFLRNEIGRLEGEINDLKNTVGLQGQTIGAIGQRVVSISSGGAR